MPWRSHQDYELLAELIYFIAESIDWNIDLAHRFHPLELCNLQKENNYKEKSNCFLSGFPVSLVPFLFSNLSNIDLYSINDCMITPWKQKIYPTDLNMFSIFYQVFKSRSLDKIQINSKREIKNM